MRLGIQLPEVEREVRWPEYLAMARAAEECGFDSIWLGDHLLYPPEDGRPERGPWEAWTLLSALAAATERVRLGPLVACAGFHPPALIAKMAATVAEVSDGRFVLGLGAGWNEREFSAYGLPYDRRVGRFEEAFAIIRGLLAGERVTLDGRFWQADDAVLLPRPAAPPPLMIGSNGPRMLSIALPHAAWWNTWFADFGNTAEGFAALDARISAAALEAGRAPEEIGRSACAFVLLDDAAADRRNTREAPAIEGTAAQIAARLRELGDAGADEVIVVASPITERSIRALGDVVAAVG
ncbi:MAG TPA: LLM class flavin-dependent oxidoreductase [Solirubrobacteraceae bacterium]|jgi:probable F420-dependent oxidoreductase|nr:LLM class flavin-dependent oxidoreductase [Solirubrobacteraceae bacterium]